MAANRNRHLSFSWIQKPGKVLANSWHQNSLLSPPTRSVLPTQEIRAGNSPAEAGLGLHREVARPCTAQAPAPQRDNLHPILFGPCCFLQMEKAGIPKQL